MGLSNRLTNGEHYTLGVPGQLEHPLVLEALKEIRRVAERCWAAPGFHVVSPEPEPVIEKLREGFRFVGYGVDMLFLGEKCRQGLGRIKNGP